MLFQLEKPGSSKRYETMFVVHGTKHREEKNHWTAQNCLQIQVLLKSYDSYRVYITY